MKPTMYFMLYFICGHRRLTRAKFENDEYMTLPYWRNGYCDECKKLENISRLMPQVTTD